MTTEKGILIIISGPSGTGKTTIIKRAMDSLQNVSFSISATTRAPRSGEEEGVSYYFMEPDRFHGLRDAGELLEFAQYAGNFYGTPKAPIQKSLDRGESVILDIEVQGASQVKEKLPQAVTIFILPPSFRELENRLRSRNQDSPEKIEQRLQIAKSECSYALEYDYIIINEDADTAARELGSIMTAARCMTRHRAERAKKIITEV